MEAQGEIKSLRVLPPSFQGLNTSLYSSLPEQAVTDIELAISNKTTGRVLESREFFKDPLRLEPYKNVAVVVIEHADLEIEFGRWGAAWKILDDKLKDIKRTGEDPNSPENRLIAITWAMVGTRHRGDTVDAAREIERTQRWLQNVPISDYTDVQTSCIRRYVITYLLTKLNTKYENEQAEHIPKAETSQHPQIPWQGLHDLRRSLCTRGQLSRRGMFNEANALFRVELNRTEVENREELAKEFLSSIQQLPSSRGRDLMEASVTLQLAEAFILLGQYPRAREELECAEIAFKRHCDHFNVTNHKAVSFWQALECAKLTCMELNTKEDLFSKLYRAEELAGILESTGSAKTGTCLSTASTMAEVAFEKTSEKAYEVKSLDFLTRLQNYDQFWSEDLCDLAQNRISLMGRSVSEFVEQENSLEWINGFLKEYKHFSSPLVLGLLYRQKASILRCLRRLEEAALVDADADELESQAPVLGEWLNLGATADALAGESTDALFFLPWKSVLESKGDEKVIGIDLLWSYLLEDVSACRLTHDRFSDIVGIPYSEYTSEEVCHKTNGTRALSSTIFPSLGGFDQAQNEKAFDKICDWLGEPPRGQYLKRLFSLLVIRMTRQWHLGDLNLWDARIRELKQLLELEEILPKEIHEQFAFTKGATLSSLALSYYIKHIKLQESTNFTKKAASDILNSAKHYNGLALEEFRKKNYRAQISLHQQIGACLCLMEIRYFQTPPDQNTIPTPDTVDAASSSQEKGGTESSIAELKSRGLALARAADAVYNEFADHATSNEGSRGVMDRSNIAEFHSHARHIHIAIRLLLLEPKKVSPEEKGEIWSWVQRYKARSLARSIGMRSSDPPGLENQIRSSEATREAYDKMMDLKDQITKARATERFHLRRQLNAHMQDMKKEPLLRKFLEIKEAMPMDISEIKKIEAQVGSPVVLVDWFYLPPFDADCPDEILLFTLKADSTVPTMDFLETKSQDVIRFQRMYYEGGLGILSNRNEFDNSLRSLIEPLSHHSKPDDVLILCPTDAIHRLPLHALTIPVPDPNDPDCLLDQPLIRRNPVVYTHSLSLLRACLNATEQAWDSPAMVNPKFLFGIPESQGQNFTVGRKGIEALAAHFNTPPMMDDEAAKENLLEVAGKSRMLHIHTHCNFEPQDPLQHHIELPRKRAVAAESGNPIDILTAREVFDLRLEPGTHVNLIACEGGLTDLKLGDEVMGMVPALLYSGACSTLSTLRPIGDKYGQLFAEYFFESITNQYRDRKQTVPSVGGPSKATDAAEPITAPSDPVWFADIAIAVQYALIKMESQDPSGGLNRWAGFVLHGFWKFPVSEKDVWPGDKWDVDVAQAVVGRGA